MITLLSVIIISLFAHTISATPTQNQCAAFARFASKWNPIPETLGAWIEDNCEKIQPRPKNMSCSDVKSFVLSCNYGGNGVQPTRQEIFLAERQRLENYYQKYYGNNRPTVLPQYTYWDPQVKSFTNHIENFLQTAIDYGQYGNWYYPNYYPGAYLNGWDGGKSSQRRLDNELATLRTAHFPYNRFLRKSRCFLEY